MINSKFLTSPSYTSQRFPTPAEMWVLKGPKEGEFGEYYTLIQVPLFLTIFCFLSLFFRIAFLCSSICSIGWNPDLVLLWWIPEILIYCYIALDNPPRLSTLGTSLFWIYFVIYLANFDMWAYHLGVYFFSRRGFLYLQKSVDYFGS